jgi:transcriptional regulator with XRE-family HTH domain
MRATVGNRPFLREWRRYWGYTLDELAGRVGSTQESLSRYETGKRRRVDPELLQRIADELTEGIVPKLYIFPAPGMTPGTLRRAYDKEQREFGKRIWPRPRIKEKTGQRSQEPVERQTQLEGDIAAIWEQLTPSQRGALLEIAKTILAGGQRRRSTGRAV